MDSEPLSTITVLLPETISDAECPTCRAPGRQLNCLGDYSHIYNSLLVGLETNEGEVEKSLLNRNTKICWECLALLKRMTKFYETVKAARNDFSYAGSRLAIFTNVGWNYELEYIEQDCTCIKKEAIEEINTDIEEFNIEVEEINTEIEENNTEIETPNVKCEFDSNSVDLNSHSDEDKPTEEASKGDQKKIIESTSTLRYRSRPISEKELTDYRDELKLQEPFLSSKYRCETCIKGFTKKHVAQNHNEKYHSPVAGDHACGVCNIHFSTPKALKLHTQKHFHMFFCRQCEYRCLTRHSIDAHWGKMHPTSQKIQCKYCDYVAVSFMHYKYHLHRHRPRKLTECDYCGKRMVKSSLVKHIQAHIGVPQQEFSCETCDFKCNGEQKLRYHIRKKHKEQPKPKPEETYCVECNMYFKSPLQLKSHLETTMKHARHILKFGCEVCPMRFRSERVLKTHIAQSHVSKACEICGHMLNSVFSYKRHMRVKHGKGTPYRFFCGVCNKAFKYVRNMKEHEWSHTGARPYTCSVCGDTFRQSAALYTHNKLKHLRST